jgi:hypothetical protein
MDTMETETEYVCQEHREAFYTYRLLQSHNYHYHSEISLPSDLSDLAYGVRQFLIDYETGRITPEKAEAATRDMEKLLDEIKEELDL